MAFLLCRGWGWPFIHPDYVFSLLTEKQFRDWEAYYDHNPWGEDRADWRLLMSECRWSAMFGGNDGKRIIPKPNWPYFDDLVEAMDPARIEQGTRSFEDAIEPDGKGGYRWKPGRGPQEVNTNVSDDHRQT